VSEPKLQPGDARTADVRPTIEHIRDIIWDDDGGIEQIYNHLIYRFVSLDILARVYLDEPDKVSILTCGAVPEAVLRYLKDRFWQIDQLGGEGYRTIWTA
jgi:hypothetical protein